MAGGFSRLIVQARTFNDNQIGTTNIGLFSACHTSKYNNVVIWYFNFGTDLCLEFDKNPTPEIIIIRDFNLEIKLGAYRVKLRVQIMLTRTCSSRS